ncbi:MAG: Crp/Fnr family transcriptional regulator [Actinomycetota bacterium]
MNTAEAAALLSRTRLFGTLHHNVHASLARLAVPRTYAKGQVIFFEGDTGESMYVVADGAVKVFMVSEEGDEIVLVTVREPDSFGELAVLDGAPRSASAAALEPTEMLVITRTTLLDVMRDHRELGERVLSSVGGLLRRLTEQTADLVFLDLPGRVAKLLARIAEERGRQEDGAVVVDLGVTQTDLARMVGGSRQSVNQALRDLQRQGAIEVDGHCVRIHHLDRLR